MIKYDDIFDVNNTGYSGYNEYLSSPKNDKKRGKVITMSPEKYIDEVSRNIFKNRATYNDVLSKPRDRSYDPEDLSDFDKIINEGKKLHLPVLNYSGYRGQEGIHRAKYAIQKGLKEIPVLVIDDIVKGENLRKKETEKVLKEGVDYSLSFSPESIVAFKNGLMSYLEDELPRISYYSYKEETPEVVNNLNIHKRGDNSYDVEYNDVKINFKDLGVNLKDYFKNVSPNKIPSLSPKEEKEIERLTDILDTFED